MSKRVLQTMHTNIQRGEIVAGSPECYHIQHTQSGKFVNTIKFQKGEIKEEGLNGIFIEDMLLISIDQLEHFQEGDFSCQENEDTLHHLRNALATTRARQYERQIRNVQGKYLK